MELSEWHMWWKKRGAAGIRARLMREWDPIGAQGIPEAADEYDSYVGTVGTMLRDGARAGELRAYLRDVRVHRIGMGASWKARRRDDAASRALVEWYEREMRAGPKYVARS